MLALLASAPAYAIYLPGAAPHDYVRGDPVPLLVNALTPQVGNRDLEIKSVLAYDHYDPRFHHCEPKGGATKQSEALGAILFGDRLRSSAFDVRMLEEVQCRTLCEAAVPAEDATFINDRIRESYAMNWLVDGLPAAEMRMRKDTGETLYVTLCPRRLISQLLDRLRARIDRERASSSAQQPLQVRSTLSRHALTAQHLHRLSRAVSRCHAGRWRRGLAVELGDVRLHR